MEGNIRVEISGGQRQFFEEHAHMLTSASSLAGNEKDVMAAVLTFVPGGPRNCVASAFRVVAALKDKGWYCTTTMRLCNSPIMGIISLTGWREDGGLILKEVVERVGEGKVTSVHVYGFASRELIATVNIGNLSEVDSVTEAFGVIAFGDGTYYKDPDDRMNTSAPLVLARRYTVQQLSEAQEQARLVEGDLEIWEFCNDNPVRKVDAVQGERVTGKYGNKTFPSKLKSMDLFG